MWEPFSLKLSFSSYRRPVFSWKTANINVSTLGQEGAGRNSSIAAIWMFIFSVAFMKNDGIDGVDFCKGIVSDLVKNSIQQKAKVFNCLISTIKIVESSDGIQIRHRRFDTLEKLLCLREGKGRNLLVSFTNLNNVLVVIKELPVVWTLKELLFINCFQRGYLIITQGWRG